MRPRTVALGALAVVAAGSAVYGGVAADASQPMVRGQNDAMLAVTSPNQDPPAGSRSAPVARRTPASTRTAAPRSSASPARRASPARTVSPAPASSRAPSAINCAPGSDLLPANVTAIVTFLVDHGYSHNAAAGIAGNIYQESKGNPESAGMGGGGLIGFTPLPTGYQTGDPGADLQTQLKAIATFNQQWASYLPALNGSSSPSSAAAVYVTDFERAGLPETATREASAEAVAASCDL